MNHAVRIHHWHNFEHKVVAKLKGILIITCQEIDNSFNDVAGHCLSWVGTTSDKNALLRTGIHKVRYCEDLDTISSQGSR